MYYQKHTCNSDRHRKRRRRIAAASALFVLIIAADVQLRPIVCAMLENQARTVFTEAINSAVTDTAKSCGLDYSDFVTLTSTESGGIASIQTNSAAVNEYRTAISAAAAEKVKVLEAEPVSVPIGSLTGLSFLTGRGPCVKLRLVERGSVTADIKSSLTESGINQTCHTISCVVDADFYAVIPGFSTPASLSASVIIAESVIVGEVPDSFTYVYGDQSDTVGRIFDYGDPYGNDVLD